MTNSDQVIKRSFITALAHGAETTMRLAALCPLPFVGTPAAHSPRDLAELLRHFAWIPKEEALLMRGLDRTTIRGLLGTPIQTHDELREALAQSIAFFHDAIHPLALTEELANHRGFRQSVLAWCLETVGHMMHHRAQLSLSLIALGVDIPRELLENLFLGHLPVDA